MPKLNKVQTEIVSSENRYIRILDSMVEGCQIISPEWRYLYVNNAVASHGNQSKEKLLGAKMMDIYPDIENTELFRVLRRCMEHRKHHSMENEFTYPDGSKRWFSLTIQPDPEGILITSVDITERKKDEETIKWNARRNELFSKTASSLLQSSSPQSIIEELCGQIMDFLDCQAFFNFMVDSNEDRLYLNACAGISMEEKHKIKRLDYGVAVCGCAARDRKRIVAEDIFHSTDSRTELVKSYGIQAYCCHPMIIEDRLIGTLSFGTSTRPRFSLDDIELMKEISNLVAIAMDRMQREERLRKSEERLRTILQTAMDGFWLVDQEGRLLEVNEAYCLMSGYNAEELHNMSISDLESSELPEEIADHMQKVIAHGNARFERKHRRKNGGFFDVEISVQYQPEMGGRFFCFLRDITERKQAEAMLREKNTLLQSFFDLPLAGIAMTSLEKGWVEVNPELCIMLGDSAEELLLMNWSELTHPDDLDVDAAQFDRVLSGEIDTYAITKRFIRKNRDVIWTSLSVACVRKPDSSVDYFIALLQDITELKNAEESLRQREKDLKKSQEIAHLGSWRLDLKTNQVKWTEELYRMYGFDPALSPPPYTEHMKLFTPESWERLSASLDETSKTGMPYELELETVRDDGRNGWMWVRGEAEKDTEGNIIALWGAAQDISESKQIKENLIRNEKKYKSLFNSTNDGICLHEIIFNKNKPIDYRILDVNPKYEELTGLKKEEAIGAIASHLYETDIPPYLETYAKVAVTGKSVTFETFFEPMDKHFIISVFSPQKHQFATVFQDVTERKKYENQIQQSQKMEAIGTLAGGIAHDFNNMCAVITGNLSYALSMIDPKTELYDVLLDIQNGANQAKKLTNQLLTFSKGGAPLTEPADLNELIVESTNFMLRGAKSKCDFFLANDLWTCEVDKGQLSQVISNLALNANQAMPNGGKIIIRTANIYVNKNEIFPLFEGQYIKITLEDEGLGISEKHIPNIFTPFFTTKQQGSGLGLATAYSVIKKHGGHITVYSELDKGTVFYIYLPASLKSLEKEAPVEQISHQGKGRVLIMDDQESILKMAGRMFTRMGYETDFALDGAEAIQKYREAHQGLKPFDLVVLDLTIPGGIGGVEAIVELLKIDPKVKAIASSGYSNDPIMSNFTDYGFSGITPKPYTKNQLAEVLNKIFGEKD